MTYTAHMIEHVILAQLVPLPLAAAWRWRRPRAAIAWAIGIAAMIGTSVPSVYSLTQMSGSADWAIRVALVVAGVIFWLPLFGRLGPGAAIVYLVTACFSTTLAGASIAFSASTTDQQIAGLVMWVPCCVVFLGAALVVVVQNMMGAGLAAGQRAD